MRDTSMYSPLAPARPGGGWSIDNSGYGIANSKTYLPRLARGLPARVQTLIPTIHVTCDHRVTKRNDVSDGDMAEGANVGEPPERERAHPYVRVIEPTSSTTRRRDG